MSYCMHNDHVNLAHVTMYLFCPHCGNLLDVEEGPSTLRFACNTCPYVQNISEKVAMKVGHVYNVYRLLCCVCVHVYRYVRYLQSSSQG